MHYAPDFIKIHFLALTSHFENFWSIVLYGDLYDDPYVNIIIIFLMQYQSMNIHSIKLPNSIKELFIFETLYALCSRNFQNVKLRPRNEFLNF